MSAASDAEPSDVVHARVSAPAAVSSFIRKCISVGEMSGCIPVPALSKACRCSRKRDGKQSPHHGQYRIVPMPRSRSVLRIGGAMEHYRFLYQSDWVA